MNFEIISRAQWGAKHGRGNAMRAGPKRHVVVHHDGINRSELGMSIEDESKILRLFEDFHVNGEPGRPGLTRSNPRIAYSWVVMQTGRIYEGIGWGRVGAHTRGLNSSGHAWCFPIHGGQTRPTEDAINAFRWHVSEGVRLGHVTRHPTVSGHQDHGKPDCPGKFLYEAAVTRFAPYVAHEVADASAAVRPPAPEVVYSDYLEDWLIVTRVTSDTNWEFAKLSDIRQQRPVTRRASAPLSQMPRPLNAFERASPA